MDYLANGVVSDQSSSRHLRQSQADTVPPRLASCRLHPAEAHEPAAHTPTGIGDRPEGRFDDRLVFCP